MTCRDCVYCVEYDDYGVRDVKCVNGHSIWQALSGPNSSCPEFISSDDYVLYRTKEEAMDAVNHPEHYARGSIECIDAIEAWGLGYHLGNAIKYICRAGYKNPEKKREDLEKAIWYIRREIEKGGTNKA